MDPTREDLPRVSLESAHDWRRLRNNFQAAAIQKMEERLAEAGLTRERESLLRHINQFVSNTFQIARPNIRVNGQNFEDINEHEEEMEPFDEALDRRIWSLSDQRLKWDREVANKRQTLPQEVQVVIEDLLERQREEDEEILNSTAQDMESFSECEIDILEGRYTSIQTSSRRMAALSGELQQTTPVQLERAERLRTVEEEVKSLKT